MATVGEPVERYAAESGRPARYDYLDQWKFVEGEEHNNLWVDAYSRSLRDTMTRDVSCQVAYQIRGTPAPEERFVEVLEHVAQTVAEEAKSANVEIEKSDDVVGGRAVLRLSAIFGVAGSHVTTFDSGTVISKPVEFDWRVEGAILRLGEDRVLSFCVTSDRDRDLALKFIDTVNASFGFELTS